MSLRFLLTTTAVLSGAGDILSRAARIQLARSARCGEEALKDEGRRRRKRVKLDDESYEVPGRKEAGDLKVDVRSGLKDRENTPPGFPSSIAPPSLSQPHLVHTHPDISEPPAQFITTSQTPSPRSAMGTTEGHVTPESLPNRDSYTNIPQRRSTPQAAGQPAQLSHTPLHEVPSNHNVAKTNEELETVLETIRTPANVPPPNPITLEHPLPAELLEPQPTPLKASKVPSSRLGRLFHYGSLAASLSVGAASEMFRSADPATGKKASPFMSEANIRRLVDKLSRMRGAALKIGQFMSIQDSKLLPEQIERVLLQVQNSANYMPDWQTEQVLSQDLGKDWESHFSSFTRVPVAAASIGQVHFATLSPSSPFANLYPPNLPLAIKVQFPGVSESIDSDLSNLRLLLLVSGLLPRGLYLENTIRVMRRELKDECDYVREAQCAGRFREVLKDDGDFKVPRVVGELSSGRVLVMERMMGEPLTKAAKYPQELRDQIGRDILKLCLRELLHFRFMQTDPNWTNFLWNTETKQIELIDFGGSREYSVDFIKTYFELLQASIREDREASVELSRKIGYLTGEENEAMIEAHISSLFALSEPFRPNAPIPYPFSSQTITDRVRAQIPVMLKNRLTPPPEETYSLNRKLSGAFLLCSRLGSRIDCVGMLEEVLDGVPDEIRVR